MGQLKPALYHKISSRIINFFHEYPFRTNDQLDTVRRSLSNPTMVTANYNMQCHIRLKTTIKLWIRLFCATKTQCLHITFRWWEILDIVLYFLIIWRDLCKSYKLQKVLPPQSRWLSDAKEIQFIIFCHLIRPDYSSGDFVSHGAKLLLREGQTFRNRARELKLII